MRANDCRRYTGLRNPTCKYVFRETRICIGGGIVGVETDVDANVNWMGIHPSQFLLCIDAVVSADLLLSLIVYHKDITVASWKRESKLRLYA